MSASRSVAVTGPISPDQAWERYAVIDRWPSWSPPIERVEANEPRLTAGMTGVLYLLGGVQIGFVVNRSIMNGGRGVGRSTRAR